MSNVYTVSMGATTIVADASLICLRAATAVSSRASTLEVLRISVSQHGTSTAQQLGIRLAQKASAFGTFTAATPSPHAIGGVASGITGSTSVAAASAGTVTDIITDAFNNLSGFLWVPTPEERIIIQPDLAFIVKIVGTPTTLTGWNASLTFRELV
jgi:hypothetical protein